MVTDVGATGESANRGEGAIVSTAVPVSCQAQAMPCRTNLLTSVLA